MSLLVCNLPLTNDDYLFFANLKMQRGYVRNVPGAPMCGCVERVSAQQKIRYKQQTML